MIAKIGSKIANIWRQWLVNKHRPLHLEFILSDYCTLRCKGCGHYSPVAEKVFADADRLDGEMAHLARTCADGLDSVYLIGGEPLLYPELPKAMASMARHFPRQKRYLFTNGLLLDKMDAAFWEAARAGEYIIAITRYPIGQDYDKIEELCRQQGVRVEVFGDRSEAGSFFRFGLDPDKKQPGRRRHFACYNRGCISVVDGKIYPCATSGCIGHLNKRFGTTFEHVEGDYIKVGDVQSAADIRRLRDHAVPFCSYCRKPEPTTYGPSKQTVDEWAVFAQKK